jgi:hypothetical protein
VIYLRWLFCLTIIALFLTGCNEKEDVNNDGSVTGAPHMTGLIYTINDESKKSILVVEGTDSTILPDEEWHGKPAINFYITDETRIIGEDGKDITVDDLKKGFKVEVWHTGTVEESYPAQATASNIKVIKALTQVPCIVPKAEEVQGETKFTIYYTCEDKLYPVHRFILDTEEISLQTVLEELLKGPTAEEQALGFHSWFSDETAGMLNNVVIEGGTAIIDFANFSSIIPNASTSAGKKVLVSQLSTVVFKHNTAENIVFQFDGSTEDFCYWMEVVCEPYSREMWEEFAKLAD